MNDNKRVTWLYIATTVLMSVVSVVFRLIVDNFYLDADGGFYQYGMTTPAAFFGFLFVCALLVGTSVFFVMSDAVPSADGYKVSIFKRITSLVAAGAMIYTVVSFFVYPDVSHPVETTQQTIQALRVLCCVLAVFSAVYYLLVAFSLRNTSKMIGYFSFFPTIWTVVYLMSLYFDQTMVMNSPVKVLQQIAFVFLLLFHLFEIRERLGIAKTSMYFALANISFVLLVTAFVPVFVSLVKGNMEMNAGVAYYIYGGLMVLYVLSSAIDVAVRCTFPGNANVVKKEKKKAESVNNDIFSSDDAE